MTPMQQPASFARVLVVLASVVVVLVGIRLAAGPILNPIFFALTLALIFAPVYGWLRRRLPTWLALLIMMIGLVVLNFGLVVLLSTSISRFTAELGSYSAQWGDLIARLQAWLNALGLFLAVNGIFGGVTPLISGLMVGNFGWRSLSLVCPVLSVVGLILIVRFVPEPLRNPDRKLDVGGILLFGICLLGIIYGMGQLQNGLSDPGTWIPLAIGIITLIAFVPWDRGSGSRRWT
jgi:predicted PurR-regulated permease PerM